MKIVTTVNEKGGSGRTTVATHIAAGLAARGQRVLLIDGDAQAHATIRCRIAKQPGLYDLLVRDANWENVCVEVPPEQYGIPGEVLPRGHLWVLPSNVETRNIANSIADSDRLTLRLDEHRDTFDVVIIDTSPTPSLLHGVFYTATDALLFVSQMAFTYFDGLKESIKRRQEANVTRQKRWGLPEIETLGIVPTVYRGNTVEQAANYELLREQYGELVWRPIPQRTRWTESEGEAVPVWNLDPNCDAAMDAWNLVNKFEEVTYVRTPIS